MLLGRVYLRSVGIWLGSAYASLVVEEASVSGVGAIVNWSLVGLARSFVVRSARVLELLSAGKRHAVGVGVALEEAISHCCPHPSDDFVKHKIEVCVGGKAKDNFCF